MRVSTTQITSTPQKVTPLHACAWYVNLIKITRVKKLRTRPKSSFCQGISCKNMKTSKIHSFLFFIKLPLQNTTRVFGMRKWEVALNDPLRENGIVCVLLANRIESPINSWNLNFSKYPVFISSTPMFSCKSFKECNDFFLFMTRTKTWTMPQTLNWH